MQSVMVIILDRSSLGCLDIVDLQLMLPAVTFPMLLLRIAGALHTNSLQFLPPVVLDLSLPASHPLVQTLHGVLLAGHDVVIHLTILRIRIMDIQIGPNTVTGQRSQLKVPLTHLPQVILMHTGQFQIGLAAHLIQLFIDPACRPVFRERNIRIALHELSIERLRRHFQAQLVRIEFTDHNLIADLAGNSLFRHCIRFHSFRIRVVRFAVLTGHQRFRFRINIRLNAHILSRIVCRHIGLRVYIRDIIHILDVIILLCRNGLTRCSGRGGLLVEKIAVILFLGRFVIAIAEQVIDMTVIHHQVTDLRERGLDAQQFHIAGFVHLTELIRSIRQQTELIHRSQRHSVRNDTDHLGVHQIRRNIRLDPA